jgi:hypothetical protein
MVKAFLNQARMFCRDFPGRNHFYQLVPTFYYIISNATTSRTISQIPMHWNALVYLACCIDFEFSRNDGFSNQSSWDDKRECERLAISKVNTVIEIVISPPCIERTPVTTMYVWQFSWDKLVCNLQIWAIDDLSSAKRNNVFCFFFWKKKNRKRRIPQPSTRYFD